MCGIHDFILFYLEIILFYFIFKLYNTVLVLPNIEMNPPQVIHDFKLVPDSYFG